MNFHVKTLLDALTSPRAKCFIDWIIVFAFLTSPVWLTALGIISN